MYLESCGNCKAFLKDDKGEMGTCRRHPPVPILVVVNQKPHPIMKRQMQIEPILHSYWPQVTPGGHCLDWVAKQNGRVIDVLPRIDIPKPEEVS